VGHLRGGFRTWVEADGDVESNGRLTVDQLADRLNDDRPPLVIDVRQASEYAAGHVPGAVHITAGSLPDRLADLSRDGSIATICASGYRASVAASLLRAAGFGDVSWVADGLPAWEAHGHPVERRGPRPVGRDDVDAESASAPARGEPARHGHPVGP
jgi:hydroxyacylglutathione hydrolase